MKLFKEELLFVTIIALIVLVAGAIGDLRVIPVLVPLAFGGILYISAKVEKDEGGDEK